MIAKLKAKLEDPETPLPNKYRVLFALKNMKESDEAHSALLSGLHDASTLLRHEVAYCLGQTQNPKGIEALIAVLSDSSEHPMVRHEAGEALGAIGSAQCIEPLLKYCSDAAAEVRETCQLALQRISRAAAKTSPTQPTAFSSVDPAPAETTSLSVAALEESLMDEQGDMFDRYKALFALRNLGGSEAVCAISNALHCESALLKHEVAFVLGQMQDAGATQSLKAVLEDLTENPMVRHEAAEALGSIAEDSCIELLKRYVRDPEPIVAESCLVALDMLEHEKSGAFEYVDMGTE